MSLWIDLRKHNQQLATIVMHNLLSILVSSYFRAEHFRLTVDDIIKSFAQHISQ